MTACIKWWHIRLLFELFSILFISQKVWCTHSELKILPRKLFDVLLIMLRRASYDVVYVFIFSDCSLYVVWYSMYSCVYAYGYHTQKLLAAGAIKLTTKFGVILNYTASAFVLSFFFSFSLSLSRLFSSISLAFYSCCYLLWVNKAAVALVMAGSCSNSTARLEQDIPSLSSFL